MIQGVFGLPRSGKSTYLAKLARKAIKKGIKVYSNYYIEGCYTLDFSNLGKYDYSDCLMLIDEISLLADSRDWKDFDSDLKYFITNHGHYNVTLVYCSQSYQDCDKKIRNCTDSLYYITKLPFGFSRVRLIDKVMGVSEGRMQEVYELSGLGHFVFRPRYYKYFDSFVRRPLPPNLERPWTPSAEGEPETGSRLAEECELEQV